MELRLRDPRHQDVGLENYLNLFSDPVFATSLFNTILYALAMVPVSIFLALVFGVILNEYVFGKGLLRLAFYLPYISSMVAVSMVWMILFIPTYGPINNLLRAIGIAKPPGWLNSSSTSLISIIIVGVWQSLGYNIIIVLAGLQGIPARSTNRPTSTAPTSCGSSSASRSRRFPAPCSFS